MENLCTKFKLAATVRTRVLSRVRTNRQRYDDLMNLTSVDHFNVIRFSDTTLGQHVQQRATLSVMARPIDLDQ